jgi:hypothetical protein
MRAMVARSSPGPCAWITVDTKSTKDTKNTRLSLLRVTLQSRTRPLVLRFLVSTIDLFVSFRLRQGFGGPP